MPTSGPHEVAFAIRGPLSRADVPGLCDQVCGLLVGSERRAVLCSVHGSVPDLVTVEALARLQLAARRRGCRIVLTGASPALLELVAYMGLTEVFRDVSDPREREIAQ